MAFLAALMMLVRFAVPLGDSTWSGFAGIGHVTQVTGEMNVPIMNCARTPNAAGASWVGIDGAGINQAVEQTGITYYCSHGVPGANAWYENYPYAPKVVPIPIHINDEVTLTVISDNGSHYFNYYVTDVTHPAHYALTTYTPYSHDASAEWVTERLPPNVFPSMVPVWWNNASFNGHGIADANENWYVPGKSANTMLGPFRAVTVMNP